MAYDLWHFTYGILVSAERVMAEAAAGPGCFGHNYIGHNSLSNDYMRHDDMGDAYTGHDRAWHNYTGCNYIGHNYTGHNYHLYIIIEAVTACRHSRLIPLTCP